MRVTVRQGEKVIYDTLDKPVTTDGGERLEILEALRKAHEDLIIAGGPKPNPNFHQSQGKPGQPQQTVNRKV